MIKEFGKPGKTLSDSESKYRSIIEQSNDLIWTLDLDGNFTYINKKAEEVTGFLISEVIGLNFAPLIPPEDLPRIQNIFIGTLKGEPLQYDITFSKKDGSDLSLSVNTAPLYESGKIIGTVSSGRDITEEKKLQAELENSEKRNRVILNAIPDMMFQLSREGRFLDFKPAKEFAPVEAPEYFLGKTIFEVLPDIAQTTMENIEKTLQTGVSQIFKYALQEEGQIKQYEARFTTSGDDNVLIVVRDITQLKLAEEKYRTLFESSSDAVMLLDENGFIDCNQATLDIFGYSKDEFIALHPADVSPSNQPDGADSLTAANQKMAHAFKVGRNKFEWVHRRSKGDEFIAVYYLLHFNMKENRFFRQQCEISPSIN